MTDYEKIKEILTINQFNLAKSFLKNEDFYSKISNYYYDYSKRNIKLIFTEFRKSQYSYVVNLFLYPVFDKHKGIAIASRFFKIDGPYYYVDLIKVSEEKFFNALVEATKPLRKHKKQKYKQLSMFDKENK